MRFIRQPRFKKLLEEVSDKTFPVTDHVGISYLSNLAGKAAVRLVDAVLAGDGEATLIAVENIVHAYERYEPNPSPLKRFSDNNGS